MDQDPALPSNDQVICVVEIPQKTGSQQAYEIKCVSDRKLDVRRTTSLPPQFVDENRMSPSFPFLHSSSIGKGGEPVSSALYVVISTHSGSRQAEDFYEDTIRPLFASDCTYEYAHEKIVTASEDSITEFARHTLLKEANKGVRQTVLLLSGDGGVVDIINVLLSGERSSEYRKPAIGLIPMGTGNALANSTGLNNDETLGLRRFFLGSLHILPTFTATFSPGSNFLVNEGRDAEPLPINPGSEAVVYGAVVCSWALHASIVADSDTTEYRKHGSKRFEMAAKELLFPSDGSPPHGYKGRVFCSWANKLEKLEHTREKSLDGNLHGYVLATMVSNLDKGFNISPHSKPLDGTLRVLRTGPMTGYEMMGIMGGAFQGGKHVENPAVEYENVESMRVEIFEADPRWRRVCVDGKIIRVSEGGWVEVRKNHADVLDIIA